MEFSTRQPYPDARRPGVPLIAETWNDGVPVG
ncbi:hypothetical protein JOD46_003512 [Agromyces aurantiacus]|nr:hypothetical protein [Agromyces aurantiacus]